MVHTLASSIKLYLNGGSLNNTKMFIKFFCVFFFLIVRLKLSCCIKTNGATDGNQ